MQPTHMETYYIVNLPPRVFLVILKNKVKAYRSHTAVFLIEFSADMKCVHLAFTPEVEVVFDRRLMMIAAGKPVAFNGDVFLFVFFFLMTVP
ncbi:hypothetical protein GDO78_000324 [Eleutherodactylus coqui]|uniref:Uncharacterized protein n=1 Tax=Eleutherodactylus coqui TaxID=57060 RepID=A0A8J6KGW5_ELECQ|nr:hypothetical protein GDO78_000324 [Eleutherodactylus coqui]